MTQLSELSPTLVWKFFEQICSIPHPSKHEHELARWISEWASAQDLEVITDKVGNLIIRKAATLGMEHLKGVILQAHLDMVPQANADTDHDFTKDPIKTYIDGEWVKAQGTTLGADNGIGAAACLAVLADNSIKHGPVEVLLTIDEETGMTGAFGLEPGLLKGEFLLNTDSEEDGEVYMGCAGGVDANIYFDYQGESIPAGYDSYRIELKGLKGGHSGGDIHLELGNANKLLSRVLFAADQRSGIRIASLAGGTLRNAIPRESHAVVLVAKGQADSLAALVDEMNALFCSELGTVEANLQLSMQPCDMPTDILPKATQEQMLRSLIGCPNGVIRKSCDLDNVVETSTNLGVIRTNDGQIYIQCLVRSLINTGRDYVEQMIRSVFELAGARCEFTGAYPGWAPNNDSAIMQTVRDCHHELFGSVPNIMVIHAGLECGLFMNAYPNWDMVSFGPTIRGAHSPDERVHIESVGRFWSWLKLVLERIPAN